MENPVLHKPTATIHVGNTLSLIERKLFNVLAWHSQKHQFSKRTDVITQDLLFSMIGLDKSKNIQHIKDCLERLTVTKIRWNALEKDKTQVWGVCTFLAGADLKRGRITYAINPMLVEQINHPTLFAKIQLLVQKQFSSKYSLALYEYFIDELSRASKGATAVCDIDLNELGMILQYNGPYKFLNKDVLKPCVKEINKESDIDLSYEPIKQGRKVVAIKWTAVKKQEFQLSLDIFDEPQAEIEDESNQELIGQLIHKGVSQRKAMSLAQIYEPDRIAENISFVEQKQNNGEEIKNVAAYLVRAIEEDYRPKKSPEILEAEEKTAAQKQAKKVAQARKKMEEEWKKFRDERAREHFAEMPAKWQEEKRQLFVEQITAEGQAGRDRFIYPRFKKEGFRSALVEANFFSGLQSELLSRPEEISLDGYAAWRDSSK